MKFPLWICLLMITWLATACVWTVTPPVSPPTFDPAIAPPTPSPYDEWTIDRLNRRGYGAGELVLLEPLGANETFDRVRFRYDSDGLTVYGFMNVPHVSGRELLPVIVLCHGRVDMSNELIDRAYTTAYADALTRAGYIVLHPNYRNHPPSDEGPNELWIGYAIDVLNLLALVQKQGAKPGPLLNADPEAVGLWGHSMGSNVALRVLTIDDYVKAGLLYSTTSGDEGKNQEKLIQMYGDGQGYWRVNQSPSEQDIWRLSPETYLRKVKAAVSIHHGQYDTMPVEWAETLCTQLQGLKKSAECFVYENEVHIFSGEDDALLVERSIAFFDGHLK